MEHPISRMAMILVFVLMSCLCSKSSRPLHHSWLMDFWLDEWAKHGMCSDNPVAYFSTAINLRNNLVSGLNLVPGIADTVDNIANTVYKQVKGRPVIHCVTRRASAQKLLGELRFCYKKGHLTIQNCTRLYSGDCNSGRDSITLL
ncbi:hypothetical protein GQ457_10G000490 [Hibiscus cannabinus]